MMTRAMKRIALVVLCTAASAALLAADFWLEKPYTEWSEKEANKLISDSPWTQTQIFQAPEYGELSSTTASGAGPRTRNMGGAPGGSRGIQGPPTRQYLMRFQSARPVRMAVARLQMLGGSWDEQQAQAYIDADQGSGNIVLAISVPRRQDRSELDLATTRDLQESTFLTLKKSKKKIGLERYIPPVEAGNIWGYFLFPRQENGQELVTLKEGEVQFECRLSKDTRLKRQFKLKKMVVGGKLEI